jgi:hypothetical protein
MVRVFRERELFAKLKAVREEFLSFTDLGRSLKPEEIAQRNLVNIHGRITNAYCANHLDADLYLGHGGAAPEQAPNRNSGEQQ